ncbi:MAG: tetratricopeptide repeat protein [Acidobacteria bacterium]|nr:tetratricopeptide repeat protein [Acidobacteriota bacterium]
MNWDSRIQVRSALIAALTVWIAVSPARAADRLTASKHLASIYDDILDADFDRAGLALAACAPAPAEACDALGATLLWWRIQLDPASTALDATFNAGAERAIRRTEAWVTREPQRAEAWFYLGASYAVRVQWRVLRNQRLAAARDGKRIKDALDKATTCDPQLHDAYFGLGLYQYYADIAPTVAKFLRWLLLLPGGNRAKGLELMMRTRERGELLRDEADYQLAIIYLWYEKQPQRALELVRGLKARHSRNLLFYKDMAEIEDVYLHDVIASLDTYRELLAAAQQKRVNEPDAAEAEARLGLARQFDTLHQTDTAIEHLQAITAAKPSRPIVAVTRAYLQLGHAFDRMGERDLAIAAYRQAVVNAPLGDPFGAAAQARARLRASPNPDAGEAYRLSLEGWRALERRELAAAARALGRSLELNPNDAVTHYRYGRLLLERKQDGEAIGEFERAIRTKPPPPGPILASAHLDAGRALERRGDLARAAAMYRAATKVFGAGTQVRARAERLLARLRLPRR